MFCFQPETYFCTSVRLLDDKDQYIGKYCTNVHCPLLSHIAYERKCRCGRKHDVYLGASLPCRISFFSRVKIVEHCQFSEHGPIGFLTSVVNCDHALDHQTSDGGVSSRDNDAAGFHDDWGLLL